MIESDNPQSKCDIILVRHAQSTFNEATIKVAGELKLSGTFPDFLLNPKFNELVSYNKDFIDTPLSEHGRHQCQYTKDLLKDKHIDLILVSPQFRALETCKRICGQKKIPVRVEPLATEAIRYACDVSEGVKAKKLMFPEYDFSKVEKLGDDWVVEMLSEEKKEKVQKEFKKEEAISIKQKQLILLRMLNSQELYQEGKEIRKRIALLKQELKELRKTYGVIGVVAHYHVIQFIKAIGFNEEGDILQYQGILNCYPYYENIQELLKIK